MQLIQSTKLSNVCYEIRGPVIEHAVAKSGGTRMPRTSYSALVSCAVCVPERGQQRAAARLLDASEDVVHATRRELAAAAHAYTRLRDAAIAGQISLPQDYDRFLDNDPSEADLADTA